MLGKHHYLKVDVHNPDFKVIVEKNRLASNSLLESLVFAKRAADVIADDKSEKPENYNEIDLSSYPPKEERQKEFKKLIMDEIKEKDKDFYDKWCNTQG